AEPGRVSENAAATILGRKQGNRDLSVFIFRRFLTLIATLVGASLIIFLVLDALPGNAAQMLMGADASPDAVRALMVKLGLDQPLHYRYVHWIKGMLTGDLGNSYAYGTPVAGLIAERLTLTIPLTIMSMSMTVVRAAILARVARSAVVEVLREEFVRTRRAKGLSKRDVVLRHVLRNAMIPVMTVMGLQFANLLAGAIVIENVFYLPGLGRLILQ